MHEFSPIDWFAKSPDHNLIHRGTMVPEKETIEHVKELSVSQLPIDIISQQFNHNKCSRQFDKVI